MKSLCKISYIVFCAHSTVPFLARYFPNTFLGPVLLHIFILPHLKCWFQRIIADVNEINWNSWKHLSCFYIWETFIFANGVCIILQHGMWMGLFSLRAISVAGLVPKFLVKQLLPRINLVWKCWFGVYDKNLLTEKWGVNFSLFFLLDYSVMQLEVDKKLWLFSAKNLFYWRFM